MPPAMLIDLNSLDLDTLEFGQEEIRKRNPQRFEMEFLTGVIAYLPDDGLIVGESRIPKDAFWIRGHIPGRPIFPGVLIVETAAQLCSFYWQMGFADKNKFFGFGGIENTRFRATVVPGDRLIVVAKTVQIRTRRAIFDVQAFKDDVMVFEGRLIGLPV